MSVKYEMAIDLVYREQSRVSMYIGKYEELARSLSEGKKLSGDLRDMA